MLVVVVVLIVTNLATLGALAYLLARPPEWRTPDPAAAASLDAAARRAPAGGTRRLITVEILNPIDLAGTRGRLAGIAGSLAPAVTRRIVHDQILKQLRQQLHAQQVVADVRVHTVRAPGEADPPGSDPQPPGGLPGQAGDGPRS